MISIGLPKNISTSVKLKEPLPKDKCLLSCPRKEFIQDRCQRIPESSEAFFRLDNIITETNEVSEQMVSMKVLHRNNLPSHFELKFIDSQVAHHLTPDFQEQMGAVRSQIHNHVPRSQRGNKNNEHCIPKEIGLFEKFAQLFKANH
ncbi:hypothetical protein TNCV_4780051 [Trichonephila clavipes]|nr:hypothetical protein TNCV_4780051 [Trichonephila clavipes]